MTHSYDGTKTKHQGFGTVANEDDMMLWNKEIITANPPPEYNYEDLISDHSSPVVSDVLKNLFRYGFLIVKETPTDEESLAKVCESIAGYVQETLYGRYYVLENKTLPHNSLAFLSHGLQAHTDISYLTAPPGICMSNALHTS